MKNQISFYIKGGEITNRKAVKTAFNLTDGRYTLEIKSNNHRTSPQNKYYWSGVIPLIKEGLIDIGYREISNNEQAHDLMKFMFLKKQIVNEKTGEVIETIGSTAKLNTIEFNDYIDRIAQFAAEFLSIEIMPPNTQVPIFKQF